MAERRAGSVWGCGQYWLLDEPLEPAAALAIRRAGIHGADRVLDVACGTGNAAILAAERGARASGVDIEPARLDDARARAHARGVSVSWHEDDALALPFAEETFTVVVSVFGVMYVIDPDRAVAEIARVCAPGARVVLASWVPLGFFGEMSARLNSHLSRSCVSGASAQWSDPRVLGERLGRAGIHLEHSSTEHLVLAFGDAEEAVTFFVDTAGYVAAERQRLQDKGNWPAVRAGVRRALETHCTTQEGRLALDLAYVLATGRAGPGP